MMTATYDPADNKLRLYSTARLDRPTYDRVKAAGFKWAPRQELFVAPMWTPGREDLLLELCGEIGDEDTSLVQRAEDRADRFEDYGDKRLAEAERAREAVGAIANGIPLAQPIFVGHHSEKRARKDAERIQNGMKRAVNLWRTSQYWQERAAGALAHAKYLERPDVRHRRIKSLEADIRRCKASYTPADDPPHIVMQQEYSFSEGKYLHDGQEVPHVWCAPKGGRGGSWVPVSRLAAIEESYRRWIEHYEHRLEYERAMLAEQGGVASDHHDLQPGGQVLVGTDWYTIVRVNKSEGQPVSVTTNSRYVRVKGVEEIKDYRPPTAELAEKVKAATKLPPLCNYPGADRVEVTQAQWNKCHTDYKCTRSVEATEIAGRHRVRYMMGVGKGHGLYAVFITDAKRKDPPAAQATEAPVSIKELPVSHDMAALEAEARQRAARQAERQPTEFDALADRLKTGVQVVAAPQLFPTPLELARQVVELAEIGPGMTVLEPSAGTGVLARLAREAGGSVECVEINAALADQLIADNFAVECRDFLERRLPGVGKLVEAGVERHIDEGVDRIVMNPPFANAADIKHVEHALKYLRPGGRLVAIVANGPRQREKLMPLADEWIDLPPDSFKESGTGVNAAIIILTK